ncbi:MAG: polyprenyl synthetase family protein [Paludibacter sp.]|jgi:geranylgeranyl diphosphate synthase type II|nr:polyprenyl synthetase family protein [Paludibacter sp.]
MKTFSEIDNLIFAEMQKNDWTRQPAELYKPIEYVMSLGGKRVRPAFAMMACNVFTDEIDVALTPAIGLEILHNFTLMHDDIMDMAEIRRGQPSVHKKWDINTAILSGDAMQSMAYQHIMQVPEKYLPEVMQIFARTSLEICEGQQFDMDFEKRESVTESEYIEMIRLKTAVLLACALKIGAILGDAQPADAEQLYNFGINFGLAFQLKDDLLDVYGDERTFGKKIGGDILCNKKTLLLINALQSANSEDCKALKRWIAIAEPSNEKIIAVTEIFNRAGVKAICEERIAYYYDCALQNLENLSVPEENTRELITLSMKLMQRND